MHIGLIGGIGPAATEFYYRNLVRLSAAAGRELELTIAHAHMPSLMQNIAANAPDAQAKIFAGHAQQLKAAGAELLGVTSIAGHFCIDELAAISPMPIVNAISELAAELTRRKLKRIGLLGTRIAMQSRLYGGLPALDVALPQGADFDTVHNEYIGMATAGRASDSQRAAMFSIGAALCREQGAQAVVLAGTDLFLAFDGRDCGFPVIDSAEVHINALFNATAPAVSKGLS
jgi:aspartate racemase